MSSARSRGQLVADFLAGSWRKEQTTLEISASDLELATKLLFDSGGVGLAWWRIKQSELKSAPHGVLLCEGYRLQALQSAINEKRILTAFRLLRDAGIEPILIKGWSVARFYPDPTLRAYGDVDLLVRPAEYSAAQETLDRCESGAWWVDLHSSLFELQDRAIDELFEHSHLVDFQQSKLRVLCLEDSLALLALHLFKHGAWRPSWLCDVAVMLESLPPSFDWTLCLGSNKWQAAWITAAIVLSEHLLDANIGVAPLSMRSKCAPEWLVDTVLKQWGSLLQPDHLPVQPRSLFADSPGSPRHLLKEICARWPDPITATFNLRGQVNRLPRFPYQLGAFVTRATQYLVG